MKFLSQALQMQGGIPWYRGGGRALACVLLLGIPVGRRSRRYGHGRRHSHANRAITLASGLLLGLSMKTDHVGFATRLALLVVYKQRKACNGATAEETVAGNSGDY